METSDVPPALHAELGFIRDIAYAVLWGEETQRLDDCERALSLLQKNHPHSEFFLSAMYWVEITTRLANNQGFRRENQSAIIEVFLSCCYYFRGRNAEYAKNVRRLFKDSLFRARMGEMRNAEINCESRPDSLLNKAIAILASDPFLSDDEIAFKLGVMASEIQCDEWKFFSSRCRSINSKS